MACHRNKDKDITATVYLVNCEYKSPKQSNL